LRASRVILLVIVVCLVGFGLLGLNSQRIDYDAKFDSKLFPIDKPTALGVCIPVEDAEAYVPLNYKFDDKFNYRIKAVGSHINFNMKFAFIGIPRTYWDYTTALTYEGLLANNMETHFWPSPLLQRIKVKGLGFLMIKKVPLNADTPETRTYKPNKNPYEKEDRWESRDMAYSAEPGDLFWIRNREHTRFTIVFDRAKGGSAYTIWPRFSGVFRSPTATRKVSLLIPMNFKSNIDVSLKNIGSFKNISLLPR